MEKWCEYWQTASIFNIDKGYRLSKEDGNFLDFFIDKRPGRTCGAIFLYQEPGKQGSVMATVDEAIFLTDTFAKRK